VRYAAGDVALNYLPLFHIAGRFVTVACLLSGAKMVLSPRFSVGSFWEEVRRHGVTTFVAVGGICHMLYSMPEREDDAENTIRAVYAVPAPAEIYDAFEERFGCKLVEAYGATETNLVVYTDLDESRKGSCGRPNSEYFDVRIVDADDEEVPTGTPGEILVRVRRPYLMMSGYYGLAEKTVEATRNLWFHTGDQAYRDDEGYVYFIDRVKDAIRRRGENISSFEVERLVTGHPEVSETAAIGVRSPLGEEDVKVVVVLKPGASLSHEELLRYCAEHMPYFMVPRYIEFVDALPRTPTEKVKKYELRQAGSGGVTADTWDREEHGLRVTRDGLVEDRRWRK
jgi:crotonobetaine/carnitine-CoA ligase